MTILNKKEKSLFIRSKNDTEKYRDYKFNLTENQFKHVINSNCMYCGESPRLYSDGNIRMGIDRVDNSKDYDFDNVIACCTECNFMKNKMTFENFLQKCDDIVKQQDTRVGISKKYGKYSPEYLKFTFNHGKYLSPNQIFKCIMNGDLTKEDIKYDFKTALKEFTKEFDIVKNQFRNKGIKIGKLSKEVYDRLQLKMWHKSNSAEECKEAEKEQMIEMSNYFSIKKKRSKSNSNYFDYDKISDIIPDITKEDIMETPPF